MASYAPLKTSADGADPAPAPATSRTRKAIFLGLVSALALVLFLAQPETPPPRRVRVPARGAAGRLAQCPSGLPPPATPPAPTNPWASLDVQESVAVYDWLFDDARGLNLTRADVAQLSDNVLYHIEAYRPSKADALAYLDDPAHTPAPTRYARVTINHGGLSAPHIADYLVGPLPVSNGTAMRPLTEIYHRPEIPFNARGFVNMAEISTLFLNLMTPLAPVTQDLFGATVLGMPNDTLIAGMAGPFSFDGSFRRGWVSWRRNVPGPWIHPISFFQYIDVSGSDPSQFSVLKIVYNHQVFSSTADFIAAWKNKTLKRLPRRPDQDPREGEDPDAWSTRRRPPGAQDRDLDDLPGPRSVSFAGLRFRVDRATQFVSWMGWQMFLGFDRDMGLSLWDVRFRGERIIYELVPQEALAQYAGNDPMQSTTAWLDRYFGMGSGVRDLLPGYDCPHEAAYLPAINFVASGYVKRERAICIFESDPGRPITRHTGYKEGEFGSVRGYVLTVRSISTVGKSTITFDYMFHIDGTIEVRVSASGYLQGGFWEPKQEGYGTAIRDTTMGSLHDHVINFKVDLDVAGPANSLLETTTAQEEVEQPWLDDDWGTTVIQQKITRRIVPSEDGARVRFPRNFQGGYALVNTAAPNRWGVPRGYAVHPGYNPVHNTVVGSKRLLRNANWAKYNLAVSLRKEDEPSSSSMFNMNLPGDPMVDFDKFFDGENITQRDLVMWINVGTHHLPQAEDSPNTRTNTAASSFFLTPLNYFDADVSLESKNAVLLTHPKVAGDPFEFDEYGVKQAHCVPPAPAAFSYPGLQAVGLDGKPVPAVETEQLRKEAELFHRIQIEKIEL